MLKEEEIKEIDQELKNFPNKRAACIEALKVVQRHRGWVTDEGMDDLSDYLDMTLEELESVATFYNLVFRKPVGKHVILVCDSVSCYIMDYQSIVDKISEILNIQFGETTTDNQFTLLPIPCLGNCDHAPAMMIDNDLHQDLTPDKVGDILKNYT